MILDVNVLLYARDETSPFHERAREWLTEHLNGPSRIGLPWSSLSGFVRISTHPRLFSTPLTSAQACRQVEAWLETTAAWVPLPTTAHVAVFTRLITQHGCTGNLVPDADLAALAIEHGVPVASTDTDFALFAPELVWVNPLA